MLAAARNEMNPTNMDGSQASSDAGRKPPCKPLKLNLCQCKWKDECSAFQEAIAQHCFCTGTNDSSLVYYFIIDVPTTAALRSCIIFLTGYDTSKNKRIAIARHHFPKSLTTYNGNKEYVIEFDGKMVTLPVLLGYEKKIDFKYASRQPCQMVWSR